MPEISIWSYAKINLSLDVTGKDPATGYHGVDMIMQQLRFHDEVSVRYTPDRGGDKGKFDITLKTSLYFLPTDSRNIAYKAAALMCDRYGSKVTSGSIRINIKKNIPVAAGMAGGSGNGAAVVHALNALWKLKLSMREILDICAELGSDVPFCAMGQAKAFYRLPAYLKDDPMAATCARATGTGTDLKPVRPLNKAIVFVKPKFSVSTPEVYAGIDSCEIPERPDNDELERQLASGSKMAYNNFVNVLENYTLASYPKVAELKALMEDKLTTAKTVLMSGSGPTVFAVFDEAPEAQEGCARLRGLGLNAYWTLTSI